jgi:branched-chain amino acid aminotransferase
MGAARFVWMDGRLVPEAEALVPLLSVSLHYGVAVFEGIRCYQTASGPAVFRLADHLHRLLASARVLGVRELPWTAAELAEAVKLTIRANRLDACYVRPLVYITGGGWNLVIDGAEPHAAIAVWPWADYLGADARERGVRANVSSFTRHHPNVTMTKAKIAGNYVNSVLAKTESVRLGFDEAVMLDAQGFVAECTGENLFLVCGDTLRTPPPASALPGITRDTVLTLARDAGWPVVETPLSRDDLYLADEVFVCGTAAEIVALREIDGRRIGAGRTGPRTRELQRRYAEVTRGAHPRAAAWLDPVGEPESSPCGR